MRLTALATLLAALTLAGTATAAPTKQAAWNHMAAAYTANAKAHGLTATCTQWNRIVAMQCEFTKHGQLVGGIVPSWSPEPCNVTLIYGAMASLSKRLEVNLCQPRWWTQPLPAPWTPRPTS